MFGFHAKKYHAFGLDVSSSSLKLVQLENRGKSAGLKSYAEAPFPKGVMVNDVITDSKVFGYLLNKALEKPQFGQINSDYAIASLPESKSFVRVIQIPKMSESEAENAVPFEAEAYIPLPVDQVYLDWQKVGETGDKMSILIIASPREFVDKYLGILEGAGVKVAALEVESQSSHRAVVEEDSTETLLIVDIASNHTSLIMVEDGKLQFTSSVPVAGNAFTESIATALGVSSAKAEEIKKKVGIANTPAYPNIKTALLPVLNSLSGEIRSILKFHNEHSGKEVKKILLVGGSARITNLPEFLAPQLAEFGELKLELGNPWCNLKMAQQPPLDAGESLSFVTAIGLGIRGMRGIN